MSSRNDLLRASTLHTSGYRGTIPEKFMITKTTSNLSTSAAISDDNFYRAACAKRDQWRREMEARKSNALFCEGIIPWKMTCDRVELKRRRAMIAAQEIERKLRIEQKQQQWREEDAKRVQQIINDDIILESSSIERHTGRQMEVGDHREKCEIQTHNFHRNAPEYPVQELRNVDSLATTTTGHPTVSGLYPELTLSNHIDQTLTSGETLNQTGETCFVKEVHPQSSICLTPRVPQGKWDISYVNSGSNPPPRAKQGDIDSSAPLSLDVLIEDGYINTAEFENESDICGDPSHVDQLPTVEFSFDPVAALERYQLLLEMAKLYGTPFCISHAHAMVQAHSLSSNAGHHQSEANPVDCIPLYWENYSGGFNTCKTISMEAAVSVPTVPPEGALATIFLNEVEVCQLPQENNGNWLGEDSFRGNSNISLAVENDLVNVDVALASTEHLAAECTLGDCKTACFVATEKSIAVPAYILRVETDATSTPELSQSVDRFDPLNTTTLGAAGASCSFTNEFQFIGNISSQGNPQMDGTNIGTEQDCSDNRKNINQYLPSTNNNSESQNHSSGEWNRQFFFPAVGHDSYYQPIPSCNSTNDMEYCDSGCILNSINDFHHPELETESQSTPVIVQPGYADDYSGEWNRDFMFPAVGHNSYYQHVGNFPEATAVNYRDRESRFCDAATQTEALVAYAEPLAADIDATERAERKPQTAAPRLPGVSVAYLNANFFGDRRKPKRPRSKCLETGYGSTGERTTNPQSKRMKVKVWLSKIMEVCGNNLVPRGRRDGLKNLIERFQGKERRTHV